MRYCRSLCVALLLTKKCASFVVFPDVHNNLLRNGGSIRRFRPNDSRFLSSSVSPSEEPPQVSVPVPDNIIAASSEALFPNAEYLDFSLLPHRPMGCTVEESLADARLIFVTKVTVAGYAEQAGLCAGDVFVGVTNLFGDLTDVTGLGIDKVKGFVGSRPAEEALHIRVARGTTVAVDHERALVDLCSNPGSSDPDTEQCVIDFLQGGYDVDDASEEEEFCDENDEECPLVDNLYNMWAQDVDDVLVSNGKAAGAALASDPSTLSSSPSAKAKVKPWSSRSSPSGTFVRDPVTGEMKNIDA